MEYYIHISSGSTSGEFQLNATESYNGKILKKDHLVISAAEQRNSEVLFGKFKTAVNVVKDLNGRISFICEISDFAIIKIAGDTSVFLNQAENSVLVENCLTLDTSGKLFIQTLKTQKLTLESEVTQLCGQVVAKRITSDKTVINDAGLIADEICGKGNFLNHGLCKAEILQIAGIINRKHDEFPIEAKIEGPHIQVLSTTFLNDENAQLYTHGNLTSRTPIVNKGSVVTGLAIVDEDVENLGSWESSRLITKKGFVNRNFGYLKLHEGLTADLGRFFNEGEVVSSRYVTVGSGENRGKIDTPELYIRQGLVNTGRISLTTLSGEGILGNRGSLVIRDISISSLHLLENDGKITGKGLHLKSLANEERGEIVLEGNLDVADLKNMGKLTAKVLTIPKSNFENQGSIDVTCVHFKGTDVHNYPQGSIVVKENAVFEDINFKNYGSFTVQKYLHTILGGKFTNTGTWIQDGNVELGTMTLQNRGTIVWNNGTIFSHNICYDNYGNWQLNKMKNDHSQPLLVRNHGTLHLRESTLTFSGLINNKNLIVSSGKYKVQQEFYHSGLLSFIDNEAFFTHVSEPTTPHYLVLPREKVTLTGEIEYQKELRYAVRLLPPALRGQENLYLLDDFPHRRSFGDLRNISTPKRVSIAVSDMTELPTTEIVNIGHLELTTNKFATSTSFKAPTLTIKVYGPLVVGSSNDALGTIAATQGPLTLEAKSVDARFGKIYGFGATLVYTTESDILVGASLWGVDDAIHQTCIGVLQQWGYGDTSLEIRNKSYIASNDQLTLSSANKIILNLGTVAGVKDVRLITAAGKSIQNIGGDVSSQQGDILIKSSLYEHIRRPTIPLRCPSYPEGHRQGYDFPGSGPASLRAFGKIDFQVANIRNQAGSIRAGGQILMNKADYKEETMNFWLYYFNKYGWGGDWGDKGLVYLTQSCALQSGNKITMNLGNFTITGSMSATGVTIQATGNGLFHNSATSRSTRLVTQPIVINITQRLQSQARGSGMLALAFNGAVQTEFPMGLPSRPGPNQEVVFNPGTLPSLANIFNPLGSINLDLYLQSALAEVAGRVYTKDTKNTQKSLTSALWNNTGRWREKNSKTVMNPTDIQQISEAMLLFQLIQVGTQVQQQTLLCLPPGEINPYQDAGDIVADTFECETGGSQTHLNNRIVTEEKTVLRGAEVHLETQSYTVSSETKHSRTVEQFAMPQQQLLSKGDIEVTSKQKLTRIGTHTEARGNVTERSESGSITKVPLVLTKMVETRHESRGLFSSSTRTETTLTHSALQTVTIGRNIKEKASTEISQVATVDSAKEEIEYDAPKVSIEALALANQTQVSQSSHGMFSSSSSSSSQQTLFAEPAIVQAPIVRFKGREATLTGVTVDAGTIYDDTEKGLQFKAKVIELLCSSRATSDSPLLSIDAGFSAGFEVMVPTMVLVDKVIRRQDDGYMLFESVIWDKSRTQIIGKLVETTYTLKKWQTSWCHIDQAIPNEALVVIAVAIAIATQGVGVKVLAPILKGTGFTLSATGIVAVNAGFSAVCSMVGTSFLRTGDPLQAAKEVVSPNGLKSIAISMASAGLCDKLGKIMEINMASGAKPLVDHFQEQALRGTIDTLLNLAAYHTPGDSLRQVPIRTVAAYVAGRLGGLSLDVLQRTTLHSVVGGVTGFAMNPSRKGFVSGAIGSMTAEVVGEILIREADSITNLMTDAQSTENEVVRRANLAKIIAGSVAALVGQDPRLAIETAKITLDNDFVPRMVFYQMQEFVQILTTATQTMSVLKKAVPLVSRKRITKSRQEKKLFKISGKWIPPTEGSEQKEVRGNVIGHLIRKFLRSPISTPLKDAYRATKGFLIDLRGKLLVPFVQNPLSGEWQTATVADVLSLDGCMTSILGAAKWGRDPTAPFLVSSHSDGKIVRVTCVGDERVLSQANLRELKTFGDVDVDAGQLKQIIKTSPHYISGQPIVLFVCHGGMDANGIAQQLANQMESPVSSFTGKVRINLNGQFTAYPSQTGEKGILKTFVPENGWKNRFTYETTVLINKYLPVVDEKAVCP